MKKLLVRSTLAYLTLNYVAVVRMQMKQNEEISKLKKQKEDSEKTLIAACVLLQAHGVPVREMLIDAQFKSMIANLN